MRVAAAAVCLALRCPHIGFRRTRGASSRLVVAGVELGLLQQAAATHGLVRKRARARAVAVRAGMLGGCADHGEIFLPDGLQVLGRRLATDGAIAREQRVGEDVGTIFAMAAGVQGRRQILVGERPDASP